MSPERDDYEDEEEYEEEEEPQSIFAATWFRALLIVIILAVVGVLALPYALDWFKAAPKPAVSVVKPAPAPPLKPPAVAPQPPAPQPPAPAAPVQPARPAPPVAPAPAPKVAEAPPKPAPPPAAPVAPPTPAPAPKIAEKPAEPAPKPAVSPRAPAPSKGDYWVQVGAFSHSKNAASLAAKLTAEKYSVQRATVTRGGGREGGNEIFAAGVAQRDLYDKVKDKGLRADAVKGGSVVRPPLPLRDAVALSKELADAGMDVKIRRVGAEKGTFYLVRVGGFADRKEADTAKAELEGKGIPGFIVKGPPR